MENKDNQANKTIKILLIEDNEDYALLLLKRLSLPSNVSFESVHVTTLAAAVQSLQEQKFDIILSDLGLPDSKGMDTFAFLCSRAFEVPIIILTGEGDEKLGIEAVRQGAQDYMVKGQFRSEELPKILQFAIQRHELQSKLRDQSFNDELTGLYNRRGFFILAEQLMKLSVRTKRSMLFLFIDIDRFKQINDSFGHTMGDQALQDLAKVLRSVFRESDVVARFGGDEFVVLGIGAEEQNRDILLNRLKAKLEEYNRTGQWPFQLSVSVGVVKFDPAHPDLLDDLIAKGDQAMYADKRSKSAK